jgi:hypothetical protein
MVKVWMANCAHLPKTLTILRKCALINLGTLEKVNADLDTDTMAAHVRSQMDEMVLRINESETSPPTHVLV